MVSLFHSGKYGVINTTDTKKKNQLVSDSYTLQNNSNFEGQNISAGELVVKEK